MHITIFNRKTIVVFGSIALLSILFSAFYFVTQNNISKNNNALNPYPEDFNFRLNFNTYGRNQIDTYKDTFTKDLVLDDTKTIDFYLPVSVKKDIYKMMMDINIMSFPDRLKVDGMAVTPSCDYKLTVTINGKTKNIVWKEGFFTSMTENLPKENIKFLNLVKFISDYIYSTNEYKNMPKANGGYD
jgi:hypothetical protein